MLRPHRPGKQRRPRRQTRIATCAISQLLVRRRTLVGPHSSYRDPLARIASMMARSPRSAPGRPTCARIATTNTSRRTDGPSQAELGQQCVHPRNLRCPARTDAAPVNFVTQVFLPEIHSWACSLTCCQGRRHARAKGCQTLFVIRLPDKTVTGADGMPSQRQPPRSHTFPASAAPRSASVPDRDRPQPCCRGGACDCKTRDR
jgi:hypothetical protein